jgi:hypothetical protein
MYIIIVQIWGTPDVVACVGGSRNPAINVKVTTDRRGHIAEYDVLDCKVYRYSPPPFW